MQSDAAITSTIPVTVIAASPPLTICGVNYPEKCMSRGMMLLPCRWDIIQRWIVDDKVTKQKTHNAATSSSFHKYWSTQFVDLQRIVRCASDRDQIVEAGGGVRCSKVVRLVVAVVHEERERWKQVGRSVVGGSDVEKRSHNATSVEVRTRPVLNVRQILIWRISTPFMDHRLSRRSYS